MSVIGETMELVTELKLQTKEFTEALNESKNKVSSFAEYANNILATVGTSFIAYEGLEKLKEFFSESVESTEKLYLATQKLGISANSFESLEFAAKKFGLTGEQVTNTIQFMQKAIGQASAGKGESGAALKDLGLNLKDIIGLSPDQQFLKIAAAMGQVANKSQEMYIGTQLFGRASKEAISWINSNLPESIEEYDKLNAALSDSQVMDVHQYIESKNVLDTLWTGFINNLTADAIPGMTKFNNNLAETIVEMGGAKTIAGELVDGFGKVWNTAVEGATQYFKLLSGIRTLTGTNFFEHDAPVSPLANPVSNYVSSLFGNNTFDTNAYAIKLTSISGLDPSNDSKIPSINNMAGAESKTSVSAAFAETAAEAKKAANGLLDLAAAAKKTKDDAFTADMKNADGSKEEIKKILQLSGIQKKNANDSDFDEVAASVLDYASQPNDKYKNNQGIAQGLKFLQNEVEKNSGLGFNTSAESNAIKELNAFINKNGSGKQSVDVNIKVTPTPEAFISWTTTGKGKQILGDSIADYTNQQARSVNQ